METMGGIYWDSIPSSIRSSGTIGRTSDKGISSSVGYAYRRAWNSLCEMSVPSDMLIQELEGGTKVEV